MISFKNISIIFKKEFLQLMRDKSVLFTNYFIPLFGMPIYALVVFELASYTVLKQEAPLADNTQFTISYQGNIPEKLKQSFVADKKLKIIDPKNIIQLEDITEYRNNFKEYLKLQQNKINFKQRIKASKEVLEKEKKDFETAENKYRLSFKKIQEKYDAKNIHTHIAFFENETGVNVVYLFYSNSVPLSDSAKRYLDKALSNFEDTSITDFKMKNNIKEHHLDPLTTWDVDLSFENTKEIKIIGMSIGGMIIVLLLISILNPTINTTIGERDNKTFQVLLMNPISIHEIFIGKFLNVALQGILTLAPYFIQFFIIYAWGSSYFVFDKISLFSGEKMLFLFFLTISVAILVSAICFLICSFAKTRIQAQSLLTFLILIFAMPIVLIAVFDITLSISTCFIPIMNFPLAIEHLMNQNLSYLQLCFTFISNLLLSFLLIWLSLGAFIVQWKGNTETKGLSDLFVLKRRKSKELIPAHGFFSFMICYLGFIYGGVLLSHVDSTLFILIFGSLFFCLGTSIFVLWYTGLDFTKVFKWDKILDFYSFKIIISTILLSISCSVLMNSTLAKKIFSMELPEIFERNSFSAYFGYFLLFALIPGITEEILFRAIIFQGFRRQYNYLISSILSSLLFALMHFSVFKSGHTFIMGLVLAYIYEKRGIYSCILMHIVFNSTGLYLGMSDVGKSILEISQGPNKVIFPIIAILVSVMIIKLKKPIINSPTR